MEFLHLFLEYIKKKEEIANDTTSAQNPSKKLWEKEHKYMHVQLLNIGGIEVFMKKLWYGQIYWREYIFIPYKVIYFQWKTKISLQPLKQRNIETSRRNLFELFA